MNGLQLIATGGALPGRTVTNEELSRTVDTSDEWITTRTGIRARHWCTEEESAATLAIAAAKQALERSGLSPQDIACCVCATLSAPDATPSVACQVQRALGLPEDRPALDVNAACSGFIYGTEPWIYADLIFGERQPEGIIQKEQARNSWTEAAQWKDLAGDQGASNYVRLLVQALMEDDPNHASPNNFGDPLVVYNYSMRYGQKGDFQSVSYTHLTLPTIA